MTSRQPAEPATSSSHAMTDEAPLSSKAAAGGRRQQYPVSTKRTLIDVATALFAEQGYAATSLDAIVAGAKVTKGALYHHFTGKQAVYEAVFEQIEADAATRIREALLDSDEPWEKADLGLRAFLKVVQEPAYQRIVVQEGPAILGYERFREQEERSTFGLVHEIVDSVLSSSQYELGEEMRTTFARVFYGALSATGGTVTASPDPAAAVVQIEAAFAFILAGLRMLADNEVGLGDPERFLATVRGGSPAPPPADG